MTFEFIIAVVFVVSAFIMGYAGGKNGYNEVIREVLDRYRKNIDAEYAQKFNEKLEREVEKAAKQAVDECMNLLNKRERQALAEKKSRLLSNREFESNQPEQCRIPKSTDISDDAFKLWALLTSHYPMERSLELDGQIQTVCQRIASYLMPHELDVLFQIDRKVCNDAEQFTRYVGGVMGDDIDVESDDE